MAHKVLMSLALAAAFASAAEPEVNHCPDGGVHFEGKATFEENEKPLKLSKDAVLTIDVAEEVPSGAEPKEPIYTHNVPLDTYTLDTNITYSFCADLHGFESKKVSLKAHIIDEAAEDKVEFIGETVVTGGSETYEADLTLAKVEQGGAAGEPSVADCQFGQMAEDVEGVAVKASVKLGVKKTLPKPTFLAVTLKEVSPESGEPEVISLFAGDISGIYEPGKPVPAFLCAKVPKIEEPTTYTMEASVHMGWDGFANADDEERTPRKGDLVTKKDVEVKMTPGQHDYDVDVAVEPKL